MSNGYDTDTDTMLRQKRTMKEKLHMIPTIHVRMMSQAHSPQSSF